MSVCLLDPEDVARLAGRSIYVGNHGYACFSTEATGPVTVHSFVMGGSRPGLVVDHINGDRMDNRKTNLRWVTNQVNQINRKRLNRNNATGVRGVSYAPRLSPNKPWRAQITVDRQNKHLGLFATREEAEAARRAAEATYYPEVCPCPGLAS